MASLKDHLGSSCPVCAKDILQAAPSRARMPPGDHAYCPSCESALSASDLEALAAPRKRVLDRLLRFLRPARV